MNPNIDSLISTLITDCLAFFPGILLGLAILLLVLLRMFRAFDRVHFSRIALAITLASLTIGTMQWGDHFKGAPPLNSLGAVKIFEGLILYDRLTNFMQVFLLGTTVLVIALSMLTGFPEREDSADFYLLLLGATLGLILLASANHLLMVFLALEMASLPCCVLAAFRKDQPRASEAALKRFIYGAGAGGVMLYGITLIAGKFGTGYLPDIAWGLVNSLPGSVDPLLVLGLTFLLAGLAFKAALVPFHFWCPDVFEGTSAEIGGFLAVAPPAAALALLARLLINLGGLDPLIRNLDEQADWTRIAEIFVPVLALASALTMTIANLSAFRQTNLKRLLAYSTIAQTGTLLLGLVPMTREGLTAWLFAMVALSLVNLAAFAIVAFLERSFGSHNLADYRGLVRRSPWLAILFCLLLLSLLGMPPLLGFMGRFQLFTALFDSGKHFSWAGQNSLSNLIYGLLAIAALNTILASVYYLRVIKVILIEPRIEDVEGTEPVPLREPIPFVLCGSLFVTAILGLGVFVNPLVEICKTSVDRFQGNPSAASTLLDQAPGRR